MPDAPSSPRSRSLRPALATSPPLTPTPLDRQAAGLVLGFPPISLQCDLGESSPQHVAHPCTIPGLSACLPLEQDDNVHVRTWPFVVAPP